MGFVFGTINTRSAHYEGFERHGSFLPEAFALGKLLSRAYAQSSRDIDRPKPRCLSHSKGARGAHAIKSLKMPFQFVLRNTDPHVRRTRDHYVFP